MRDPIVTPVRLVPFLLPLLLTALIVAGASADPPARYETYTIAEYAGRAYDTRICTLGAPFDFTVAWVDPDGNVCTSTYESPVPGPVVVHGPGDDPVLIAGAGASATLAYSDGNHVVLRTSSGLGAWGPPVHLSSGFEEPVHHPDLAFAASAAPSVAWIEGNRVMFAEGLPGGGWAAPEIVAADVYAPHGSGWGGAQLEAWIDSRLRVYYLHGDQPRVVWRNRIAPGQWTYPLSWPDSPDLSAPFRVCAPYGFGGGHALLALGKPLACTCGSIYFTHETSPNIWSSPSEITVHAGDQNWPQCPSVWNDESGAHCFWYQSAYEDWEYTGEKMYYRVVRPDGTVDEPWTFDTQVGRDCDVSYQGCDDCARGPEFCWIERTTTGGSRVVVLHDRSGGLAAGDPPRRADLTVVPNPTDGATSILWSGAPRGPARLEVFDASGRMVRRLSVEPAGLSGSAGGAADGASRSAAAGGFLRFVWDGRTDSNRPAAAGVYQLRVITPGGTTGGSVVRLGRE